MVSIIGNEIKQGSRTARSIEISVPLRRWRAFTVLISLLLIMFMSSVSHADEPPNVIQSDVLKQSLKEAFSAKGLHYKPRTKHLHADGSPQYTNRLILEGSPYLLQHAHNPVDWYAWGPEAFAKARAEKKPIFLSIGYSTCHWCHVMERESFEDVKIAAFLNQHFVSIKLDRERRPDIDEVYMMAVLMLTGRGGWPMSSFLDTQGRTFYGGTYYPRDVFLDLLQQIEKAWRENREGVESDASIIAAQVTRIMQTAGRAGEVNYRTVQNAVATLQNRHDDQYGGLGPAPKFPNEPSYLFLLDEALRSDDDEIHDLIRFDLHAMARGGIYDQVGGGFHRYSTDSKWLVPHFEKMLYNQAQLSRIYAQAWRQTGDAGLARIARQTLDYVLRDMTSPYGGFFSATDADSSGGEGLFFLWTEEQIRAVLSPADADLAIELYGVTEGNNFEGTNILNLPVSLTEFATQRDIKLEVLLEQVENIRTVLYAERVKRVHPDRDEKIVTAWNGMMIAALAEVAEILSEPRYHTTAIRAAEFLWNNSRQDNGELWRVRLDDRSSVPAVQEDYAWLADGFLHLYDTTRDPRWLERAKLLVSTMNKLFWDDKDGGYFMNTNVKGISIMARPKSSNDGAVPSGNAVALHVLAKLAQRTGEDAYNRRAKTLLAVFASSIDTSSASFSYMLRGAQLLANGMAGPRQYAARGAVMADAQLQENSLVVDLAIRPGWHIQSHKPLQKELIPTMVGLEKPIPGWRAGAPTYPSPIVKTLGFLDEKLSLYEGDVRISMDMTPTETATTKPLIPIVLRVQACDDSHCLPPERRVLQLPTNHHSKKC